MRAGELTGIFSDWFEFGYEVVRLKQNRAR
jgi:hypothetical protein